MRGFNENLAKLAEGKLTVGVKVGVGEFRAESRKICKRCILGKQIRQPFPDGVKKYPYMPHTTK
jgi:hypothetical protein